MESANEICEKEASLTARKIEKGVGEDTEDSAKKQQIGPMNGGGIHLTHSRYGKRKRKAHNERRNLTTPIKRRKEDYIRTSVGNKSVEKKKSIQRDSEKNRGKSKDYERRKA